MTRAAEPTAPARTDVSDLDAARRRRTARASARTAPEDDASGTPEASDAPAPPAKRRRDPANRRFDTVKVARLKREIEAGAYSIDCWSVADRFIEHERNRG